MITDLTGTYIKVNSPEESERVQKKAFEMGYTWKGPEPKTVGHTDAKYLTFRGGLRLNYGNKGGYGLKLITLAGLFGEAAGSDLEVGKWYWSSDKDQLSVWNGGATTYGFYTGSWSTSWECTDTDRTPATDEEVKEALIAEAERRDVWEVAINDVTGHKGHRSVYGIAWDGEELWSSYGLVFRDDKFATKIEDEAKSNSVDDFLAHHPAKDAWPGPPTTTASIHTPLEGWFPHAMTFEKSTDSQSSSLPAPLSLKKKSKKRKLKL